MVIWNAQRGAWMPVLLVILTLTLGLRARLIEVEWTNCAALLGEADPRCAPWLA